MDVPTTLVFMVNSTIPVVYKPKYIIKIENRFSSVGIGTYKNRTSQGFPPLLLILAVHFATFYDSSKLKNANYNNCDLLRFLYM